MQKRRVARIWIVLIAIALPFAAGTEPPGASAQDGGEPGVARTEDVEMIVRAGFGRVGVNYYTGTWVPFRISVSNQGKPITGRLVVRSESNPNPSTQTREFVKDVQLPTGSKQFHEISVFLNSIQKEPEVILLDGDAPVVATTVKVDRNSSFNDELDVVVVDTDQTTLNSITSKEIFRPANRQPFKSVLASAITSQAGYPAQDPQAQAAQAAGAGLPPPPPRRRTPRWSAANKQGPSARPTVIASEDLPRDFVSYDALDALVLCDAPLSQLTAEQARALKMYVASGGMLVVTGAADIAGLRSLGLDEMLPVDAHGTVTAPSVPELTQTYGRFESSDPTLVLASTLRPNAETLLGAANMPIVAERFYGSGLVRFVAINPKINPYRGWGGAKELWNDLLLPSAESKPRRVNWITAGNVGGVQHFLFKLAGIEPPSPNYFIIFLVAYILIVGPLNYLVLRWMRKLELAWLTIPAVVLVFTGVSVAVAQISRGTQSVAADVSLVELHQNEGIVKNEGALMIMPASKGTQQLAFEGPASYANDMVDSSFSGTATSESIQAEREADRHVLSVPMNTWTAALFRFRSIGETQSRLASVEQEGDRSKVRVRNLGDAPITGAVYISREGISDIFDLAAGGEIEVGLSSPPATKFSDWYMSKLVGGSEEAEVFSSVMAALDREVGGQRIFQSGFFDHAQMTNTWMHLEKTILVGFIEKCPTALSFKTSLRRNSKAFYVVHL